MPHSALSYYFLQELYPCRASVVIELSVFCTESVTCAVYKKINDAELDLLLDTMTHLCT